MLEPKHKNGAAGGQLRPIVSGLGDRNRVGLDHLVIGHPGINVLKSAIYL